MANEKLELIEKSLKSKNVKEYEIYLIEGKAFESIFLKDKVDNERDISNFEYTLRILSQKENQTGIGIIKGNSLDLKEIERNIDICISIAKNNLSSMYYFPSQNKVPQVSLVEKKVVQDPLGIKNELTEELITEIRQQREVQPTFGRFRVHIDEISLRNSNELDLSNFRTYFFIELSLKAHKNGKLAEYWPFSFFKDSDHLNFSVRVPKWAKLAQDTLKAKIPLSNNKATVIFTPRVLQQAINPVIGTHASGQAFHQKISQLKIGDKVTSDNITIIDDGLLEGALKTNGWDGEGSPHQRNVIIKNGVFQRRLYDQKYAIIENEKSTGNGIRGITGGITNSISNLEILPGELTLDEMISNINEGYYIEQFSWLNPSVLSGSFGAEIRSGYYIKDGKYQYPIKLGNVSGNVLKMVRDCQNISKEREYCENSHFPYMVFNNLTVSS